MSDKEAAKEAYKDEKTLREMYHGRGLSTREIASRFDCDGTTVRYWMEKHEIQRRAVGSGSKNKKELPIEEIAEQYRTAEKSSIELAEKHGVTAATITSRLEKVGVETRTKEESLSLKVPDSEKLHKLHHEDGLKLKEIAEKYDVSHRTVSGWFNRRDIDVRVYTGEESARWSGGHEQYYGPNWPEQRQKRLERDDYQCVVCGLSNEEHKQRNGSGLHVHHIQPLSSYKSDGEVDYKRANRVENLISLCQICHNKWEGIPVRPQND